jgi:hypothetical protein
VPGEQVIAAGHEDLQVGGDLGGGSADVIVRAGSSS